MAKSWEEIIMNQSRVPMKQTLQDKEEMLKELGMTLEEFRLTEEYRRGHKLAEDGYFWRERKKQHRK